MKGQAPIIEDGVLAGNLYDKYGTKNPIARYLMKGFIDSVEKLVSLTEASDIHEVGCGEGHLSVILAGKGRKVRTSDFSRQVVDRARENAMKAGVEIDFRVASIYDLVPERDAAELVVCCEVLEHLDDPGMAMAMLSKLARSYLLVSVPREPVWRVLNMARGKYLGSFGNTPGHIQHWSRKGFLKMLEEHVDILKVLTPFPWTVALCRGGKKSG